jgi:hypothetical protein
MNTSSSPKSQVVARMTVTRKLGVRTIIEVHSDSTFQAFYHFYTQQGAKRSTRKFIRTAGRNEGLPYIGAHRMTPGLEILACRWATMQHVERVQVRILRKRAYRKLINARASDLGQAIVRPLFSTPIFLTTHHS